MERTYKEQIVTTSTGRKIWIYDDVFTYQERTGFYEQAQNSFFRIRGSDNDILEYKEHVSVVSMYNPNDVRQMGIYDLIPEEIRKKHHMTYENIDDTMINMVTPSDRFHVHVDNDSEHGRTFVYYMNLNWDVEWGGDTLFLDEEGKNIEFCSQFKPGRFILFDPKIPHMIRPSTVLAPHFRFSLASKFIPHLLEKPKW